ncbi:MAG: DUF2931 family protein, partial [Desulfobacteraceae bacterium]|nr:DUF2931 family protein [Desulfobacteraceae bacterium]
MMDKKKIIILFSVIMACLTTGCMQKDKIMKKFEWLPTECAPKNYPMKIVRGDFIFKNKNSIYIPDGRFIMDGWGEVGSIDIVGEDFKPLPVRLRILWFSYTEDKFYAGDFDLPYEKI